MIENKDKLVDGLVHDEVEIEDFEYDPDADAFVYPCPCGDEFSVSRDDLMNGEKYAKCPSCSLMVLVIYNIESIKAVVEVKSARKDSKNTNKPGIRATS